MVGTGRNIDSAHFDPHSYWKCVFSEQVLGWDGSMAFPNTLTLGVGIFKYHKTTPYSHNFTHIHSIFLIPQNRKVASVFPPVILFASWVQGLQNVIRIYVGGGIYYRSKKCGNMSFPLANMIYQAGVTLFQHVTFKSGDNTQPFSDAAFSVIQDLCNWFRWPFHGVCQKMRCSMVLPNPKGLPSLPAFVGHTFDSPISTEKNPPHPAEISGACSEINFGNISGTDNMLSPRPCSMPRQWWSISLFHWWLIRHAIQIDHVWS